MNATEKAVAISIFNDLHARATNIQDHADRKLFGDKAAEEDAARAKGLRTALQYMAEHIYSEYDFDVERAAKAAREGKG